MRGRAGGKAMGRGATDCEVCEKVSKDREQDIWRRLLVLAKEHNGLQELVLGLGKLGLQVRNLDSSRIHPVLVDDHGRGKSGEIGLRYRKY